jgi:hypothetical protein
MERLHLGGREDEGETNLLPQVGPWVVHVDLLGVVTDEVQCPMQ